MSSASSVRAILLAGLFALTSLRAVAAPDPAAAGLVDLVKPLMQPASPYNSPPDWSQLDTIRTIRWRPLPPVESERPSPDGNYFVRPGQAVLAGRPIMVVASGARTMVMSYYFQNAGPPMAPDDIAAAFRQAGFAVTAARCPINPAQPSPRRWYRLTGAQKRASYFYVGPLASGGQGYTLFTGDDLPPMTQAEASLYTDRCAAGASAAAPGPARPATGQAGVVAVIEGLLRPPGSAPAIPWASLASLPAITWNKLPPARMTNPFEDGGPDANPRLLEGQFKTATTRMSAIATGDDRAASRVALLNGGNLPRGAVFDALARDGYALSALRCGKAYLERSEAWFRITGAGKQPAILYRAVTTTGGVREESYVVRIDNVMPPMQPGQSAPVAGRCPDRL